MKRHEMNPRDLSRAAGAVLLAGAVLFLPGEARAYGGPGSVITGLGAFLAAVAAIAAAIFGFLWFPVKKLIGKIRGNGPPEDEESAVASEEVVHE